MLVLAVGLYVLASAGAAGAATGLAQKEGAAGCITEAGLLGFCQDGRGLTGPAAIALSPDGVHAYVASSGGDAVATLNRQSAAGTMAPIQAKESCFYSEAVAAECTPTRQLDGASDIAVSPDGLSVYVSAAEDDAVTVFQRNPASGLLSPVEGPGGCVNASGAVGCADGRALAAAAAVTVSPDGRNVYVVSRGPNGGIAVFSRDATTGALSQLAGSLGCVNTGATGQDPCALGSAWLMGARDIEISPDGAYAYVVSAVNSNALTLYRRDLASGALTPIAGEGGCFRQPDELLSTECQRGDALVEPSTVTIDPSGKFLYVGAMRGDSIAIFDRDSASGLLSQKPGTAGCISNTGRSHPLRDETLGICQNGVAIDGVSSIALLPDGTGLYATTAVSNGIVLFDRDPATGTLAQKRGTLGCLTVGGFEDPALAYTKGTCQPGRALGGASDLAPSADGRFLYTAAADGIAIFDVVQQLAAPSPPPGPAPAPNVAPETLKRHGPAARVKTVKRRARVRFSFHADDRSATFRCRLDRGRLRPCASPVVRRLLPGKHRFSVAAVDQQGMTDPTPVVYSFKVVRVPQSRRAGSTA
jgi:6-phosphogluconolactonase (cycloisomerase 2 family)